VQIQKYGIRPKMSMRMKTVKRMMKRKKGRLS